MPDLPPLTHLSTMRTEIRTEPVGPGPQSEHAPMASELSEKVPLQAAAPAPSKSAARGSPGRSCAVSLWADPAEPPRTAKEKEYPWTFQMR